MNVLHVNNIDLQGRRFNGYDLLDELQTYGVSGKQIVLTKLSQDPDVVPLLVDDVDEELDEVLLETEQRYGMNDLLYPWGRVIARMPEFVMADVVHYHLIHNRVVSLLDLPDLFGLKPSVWTFHDPWPLTGHCIYPQACEAWVDGCETCLFLERPFAMRCDCARQMWTIKEDIYAELDVDVVVASEYMYDLVRRSPLTSRFERVHLIPFGVKLDGYLPDADRPASRERLGIPPDDFVVFFRAATPEVKGVSKLVDALRLGPPARPTTLLTVDARGLLDDLGDDYNIVELGWVEDESLYASIFSACDAFVMPSLGEAFGLMALEAMAAGRPVVCFEGTSLPAVTHAPDCGIAVPMGDSKAMRAAIDELMDDSQQASRRGELGRQLARTVYGHERYLSSLASLYESVLARTR